jgi:hypothetical protein
MIAILDLHDKSHDGKSITLTFIHDDIGNIGIGLADF